MIDEQSLTDLIARRSDMSREAVEGRMAELVEDINAATRRGELFTVEGFGTFRPGEDATVFDPGEVLQTEINQKYAGMKPIELMGSFKEAGSGGPIDISDRPEFEKRRQPVPAAEPEETVKPDKTEATPESETEVEEKRPQQEPTAAERETLKPAAGDADDKVGRGSAALIAASIIVAILLAGWLFYNMGFFDIPFIDEADNQTVVTRQIKQPSDNLSSGTMSLTSVDKPVMNENVNATAGSALNETEEQVPLYGLKGPVQDGARDGYTIVVHSLQVRQRAARVLENIKQQGFRAMMLRAVVDGTVYWRLGIGQFKTIEDAQEAALKLPQPYRSRHFIKHQ